MKFFLLLLLGVIPVAAGAQVYVNPAALDQLAGISAPAAVTPVMAPAARPVLHHSAHKRIVTQPAVMAKPAAAQPAPVPVVAKPAMPPQLAQPLPKLAPVTVTFAAASAALPETATAALKPVCDRAKAGGAVNIAAYAAGADPSTAMRLSLSRAFALRDTLTACGVPATRILPRALGEVAGKDSASALIEFTP